MQRINRGDEKGIQMKLIDFGVSILIDKNIERDKEYFYPYALGKFNSSPEVITYFL